jgi:hypothetical protein
VLVSNSQTCREEEEKEEFKEKQRLKIKRTTDNFLKKLCVLFIYNRQHRHRFQNYHLQQTKQ